MTFCYNLPMKRLFWLAIKNRPTYWTALTLVPLMYGRRLLGKWIFVLVAYCLEIFLEEVLSASLINAPLNILHPVALQYCTRSATLRPQFSALWFPSQKCSWRVWMISRLLLYTSVSWYLNFASYMNSPIWGPTATPSLILASLILRNLDFMYINQRHFVPLPWRNFFMVPSWICNRGK